VSLRPELGRRHMVTTEPKNHEHNLCVHVVILWSGKPPKVPFGNRSRLLANGHAKPNIRKARASRLILLLLRLRDNNNITREAKRRRSFSVFLFFFLSSNRRINFLKYYNASSCLVLFLRFRLRLLLLFCPISVVAYPSALYMAETVVKNKIHLRVDPTGYV